MIRLEEVLIIGAGPCGISVAIECKKRGFNPLVIEKGAIVNTIYTYPLSMTFFSSADKIEIGNIPFPSIYTRPTREEAIVYYRTIVQRFGIRVHTYEKVIKIERQNDHFLVFTKGRTRRYQYRSKYVVIATGYYDQPNWMKITGEDLPHVFHYFQDAHPYAGRPVVVIGGRHSAIQAALDLQQAGADVTMVYRRGTFDSSIKPWIRPLIENAIKYGRIKMFWNSAVTRIQPEHVEICQEDGQVLTIPADAVFAMTGYRPNLTFFKQLGAAIDAISEAPIHTENMETTVPNLYVAGVVVTGNDSSKVFIENGRFHAQVIVEDILRKEKDA